MDPSAPRPRVEVADVRIRDLRYFVAVAEELHFTFAAQRLSVSQPALSKQIAELERRLDTKLLARNVRGLGLTPAGETLLPLAVDIIARWEAAHRGAHAAGDGSNDELSIGFFVRPAHDLLRSALAILALDEPAARVRLKQAAWDEPLAGLLSGSSDVAILGTGTPSELPDRVSERLLFVHAVCLVATRDHPLAGLQTISFADLAGETIYQLPDTAKAVAARMRSGAPLDAPVTTHLVMTVTELMEAVQAQLGVAVMTASATTRWSMPGLVTIPVSDIAPVRVVVLWRSDDDRQLVHQLVDACVTAAQQATAPARELS